MTEQSKKIIAEGKYIRLVSVEGWEYVERKKTQGVVSIIAVTDENKVLLVEQRRASLGGEVIELPAGLVGDDGEEEDYAEAARRELLEETGYEAEQIVWLTAGPSSSGLTNEIINFYAARGLKRRHQGGGVKEESIKVHEVSLADIDAWLTERVRSGRTIDPRIYIGLYFVGERNKKDSLNATVYQSDFSRSA